MGIVFNMEEIVSDIFENGDLIDESSLLMQKITTEKLKDKQFVNSLVSEVKNNKDDKQLWRNRRILGVALIVLSGVLGATLILSPLCILIITVCSRLPVMHKEEVIAVTARMNMAITKLEDQLDEKGDSLSNSEKNDIKKAISTLRQAKLKIKAVD